MPQQVSEVVGAPSLGLILYWLTTGQLWRLGKGEDPSWGTRAIDQVVLQATIHELASNITDEAVRKHVQGAVSTAMANAAGTMAKAAGHK